MSPFEILIVFLCIGALYFVVFHQSYASGGEDLELNPTEFESFTQSEEPVTVMFYAPWCGHCTHMKPDYIRVARRYRRRMRLVNGHKYSKLMQRMKIRGYPTIRRFQRGIADKIELQDRSEKGIETFVKKSGKKGGKKQKGGRRVKKKNKTKK